MDAYLFVGMNNYSASAQAAPSDLLSAKQIRRQDLFELLSLSRDLRSRTMFAQVLRGKSVAMIFEKPSLRTRVTFEVAIRQLGGWPVMLGAAESRLGEREPVQDLALFATIPVINGLSDAEHPCQALADLLALSEAWPSFSGKELVYVGDWNNVSRSLFYVSSTAGLKFRAVCPEKYGPAGEEGVDWSADPSDVKGADAIYTDVWASMGQEDELV